MKIYDFDGMFDKKLSGFIEGNKGKYTQSEWEDVVPELYKKFGDTVIKTLGDTPNGYYGKMTDSELVKTLRSHLKNSVPVSGFLRSAIEGRNTCVLLQPLLDGSPAEREFAVNMIGSDERVIKKYFEMLVSDENDGDLKNLLLEHIKEKADLVIDGAVANYKNSVEREFMLEIMSRSVIHTDAVFEILLNEFRSDPENLSLHAGYLASYGDGRALEYLYDKIEEEGIAFVEFRELKFAIEALGGEYSKERDFSDDKDYNIITSHEVQATDLFGSVDKK